MVKLLEHLAHNDFNMLVVNAHAPGNDARLLWISLNKIMRQVFLALGPQNACAKFGIAFCQGIACIDVIAVRYSDMLALALSGTRYSRAPPIFLA